MIFLQGNNNDHRVWIIFILILCHHALRHNCSDFSSKVSVKIGEVLPLHEERTPGSGSGSSSSSSSSSSDSTSSGFGFGSSNKNFSTNLSSSHRRRPIDENEDKQENYSNVNIRVLGENIDVKTLMTLKPEGRFTNSRRLMRVLSTDFDHDWMSVEAPPISGRFIRNPSDSRYNAELLEQVKNINFTFVDSSGATLLMKPEILHHLHTWMLQLASCPMDYIWEDLGPLFWPRFIKRGVCLNTRSCSWPAGMHCRPSGTKEIKLLHWSCQPDNNGEQREQHQAWMQRRRQRRELKKSRHLRAISASDFRTNLWVPHTYDGPYYQRRMQRSALSSSVNTRLARQNSLAETEMDPYGSSYDTQDGRRARRIIQGLSLAKDGFFCQWQPHKYVINDQCSCNCH